MWRWNDKWQTGKTGGNYRKIVSVCLSMCLCVCVCALQKETRNKFGSISRVYTSDRNLAFSGSSLQSLDCSHSADEDNDIHGAKAIMYLVWKVWKEWKALEEVNVLMDDMYCKDKLALHDFHEHEMLIDQRGSLCHLCITTRTLQFVLWNRQMRTTWKKHLALPIRRTVKNSK